MNEMNAQIADHLEVIRVEIAKLQLHPDDVLLVWVPDSTSKNEMRELVDLFGAALNGQGILLRKNIEVKVVRVQDKEESHESV